MDSFYRQSLFGLGIGHYRKKKKLIFWNIRQQIDKKNWQFDQEVHFSATSAIKNLDMRISLS